MSTSLNPTLEALLRASGMSEAAIQAFIARANDPPLADSLATSNNGSASTSSSSDVTAPPFMSFDPALEAEQRALERGLENLLQDTHREKKYAKQDAQTSLHDLKVQKRRGLQDLRQQKSRGVRDIATRTTDVNTSADRQRADFGSRLTNLIHNSAVQGDQQFQAANAAGVLDASTTEASAAARAGTLARARAPIDTGLQRVGEDQTTALGKLATAQGDLLHDSQQGKNQLRQDTRHDVRLQNQQLARTLRDIHTRRQRAREEAAIGQVDLTQQEIYQARQNNPGAFSRSGNRRHGGN